MANEGKKQATEEAGDDWSAALADQGDDSPDFEQLEGGGGSQNLDFLRRGLERRHGPE